MPGPTLDVHDVGGGVGVGVGAGVGVGVTTIALMPAIWPATTCACPSVMPLAATRYAPGAMSTNANQPLPSLESVRSVAPAVVCRSIRAFGVVVPLTWPADGCVFHGMVGTDAVLANTAGDVVSYGETCV